MSTATVDQPCTLDENDYCQRHHKRHVGRERELALMANGDGAKYRALWDTHVGVNKADGPCRFQGTTVRDAKTGRAKTAECGACQQKNPNQRLKVFQCDHPYRGGEVSVLDCNGCKLKEVEPRRLRLRFGHGLGDAVQFRRVLAHFKLLHWQVEVAAPEKYAGIFADLVTTLLPWNAPDCRDVRWLEGKGTQTKAQRCLQEEFELAPLPVECGMREDPDAAAAAAELIVREGPTVAIHGAGVSCPQKNLPQDVVDRVVAHVRDRGYNVLLVDSQDPFRLREILARTACNVVVDSGPHKLCSGSERTISVWPASSPIHYVDEPGREVFLVPANHAQYVENSNGVYRQCDAAHGIALFEARFRHRTYYDLAETLCDAVDEVLGLGGTPPTEPTGKLPEKKQEPLTPVPAVKARKLLLHTGLPPGDVMTLTATVHVLHEQYPGKYLTAVSTDHPELWENNPHVVPAGDDFERVEMHYHTVNQSGNRPVHFIGGYTEMLADHLGIKLVQTTNRPHLYLSEEEKGWMNQVWEKTGSNAPYWIVNAGVKRDYTAKQYPFYQEVVDLLKHKVRFVQIGLDTDLHPPLRGVVNFVGQTSQRALVRLAYWCQGVLSGVTFLMHLAAAFEKPAVIVAGGREPRLWNSYPCQTLLANVGATWAPDDGCCKTGGCWKSRVTPEQNDGRSDGLCVRPMPTVPPAGECMTRISPELVAMAIESYLP